MAINEFSASGTMNPETYVDNLDAAIELLWMRRDEHKGVLEQYFEKLSAKSLSFKMSSVSSVVGLPRESNDEDPLAYVQPAPGFDKTFNLITYRSGIRVTDTMVRADRQSKIVSMAAGLMKSAMRKEEYLRASIFNNAFTGTAGADSLPLVDDSHDHENPEAGTWDNEGTGALTFSNLQALHLLGRKMTNEKGHPDPVLARQLLVGEDLRQKAMELTGSVKNPENALNQEVKVIGGLDVVVSPFITSSTAYFLIGDRVGEDRGMYDIALLEPQMANNKPASADIVIDKRVKMIKVVGFSTSKNILGSVGT